jgi:hypothetical protein
MNRRHNLFLFILPTILLVVVLTLALSALKLRPSNAEVVAAAIRSRLQTLTPRLYRSDGTPALPLPVSVCLTGWPTSDGVITRAMSGLPWKLVDGGRCIRKTYLVGDVAYEDFRDENGSFAVGANVVTSTCLNGQGCSVNIIGP